MNQAAERYFQLMLDLLAARNLAGGDLTDDEEARRAEELDEQWSQMTQADREQAEAVFSGPSLVGAPEPPRREAA
jgi:hypothetical protein